MEWVKCTILVVGLIVLYPSKLETLFEYCENNNCTQTGTICQITSNVCVCNNATHYQTATDICDAKIPANSACPNSLVNSQTPCLGQNAWCRLVGTDYNCTCDTGYSANSTGQCVEVTSCGRTGDSQFAVYGYSFICSTGYTVGDSNATRYSRYCTDGSWIGPSPSCTPVDCGSLIDPTGGTVSYPNTLYGVTATYTCNKGYTITAGDGTRSCLSNTSWSGSQPTCSRIDCGSSINTTTNGQATGVITTYYQSTATVICNQGHENPTPTSVVCQANGQWSSATCSPVNCGSSINTTTNGQATGVTTTDYQSTATVICNQGHENPIPTSVVCQANGQWSSATCSPVSCGNMDNITNGYETGITSNEFGGIATVTCNPGYENPTPTTVTCQANGQWSAASCTIKDCGALSNPVNGTVTTNPDTKFGATATYTCNSGYVINGTARTSKTLTCTASGVWSGNAPICSKIGLDVDKADPSPAVPVVATVVPIFVIIAVAIVVFTIYRRRSLKCLGKQDETSPRSEQNNQQNTESNIAATPQFYDLTNEMTDKEVIEWMKVHGFEKCKTHLKGFTGMDMLNLSKKDLTKICGVADGIRIYNRLKGSSSTRQIADGSGDQHSTYMELDDTKRDGIPYENIEMDRSHLYSALQHV